MNWSSSKAAKAQEFNGIIDELASARQICVADAWTAMEQCGHACIHEDGFHPNVQGHELIAQEMAKCW